MNILDYLGTEFASFEEKPFNPVDSAALSQFCMVRAEGIAAAAARAQGVRQARHHREEPAIPFGTPRPLPRYIACRTL
mgnify:CR=1 FL=1